MSLGKITKNAIWVYIGSVSSSILGYVFWIIASSYVSPDAIGSASAILALQALLLSIASFGLSTGVKRFTSLRNSDTEYQEGSSYFTTALVMTFIVNIPMVVILLIFSVFSIPAFGLAPFELGVAAVLLCVGFWSPIIVALFDSLLETKTTAVAQIVSTLVKLGVGAIFFVMDLDFIGIILAFIFSSIAIDVILLLSLNRIIKRFSIKLVPSYRKTRDLILGSIPAWIPNTLMIAGQSFGVLVIYTAIDGTAAGLYYIAYAIASIVYTLPTSILGLMFPVLSGMEDGRKAAISDAMRLSLVVTIPIGFIIALYPQVPFILISSDYRAAYPLLSILVLGAVVYPIYAGYYGYVYAIGEYSHVLLLGISLNVSRMLLYILFISTLGSTGIAIAYSVSIVMVLLVMIPSSRKIGFILNWKGYLKPIFITGCLGAILFVLSVPWVVGIPVLLVLSLISYTRLAIITKIDIREVSEAFLSDESLSKISLYFKPILRILFGE